MTCCTLSPFPTRTDGHVSPDTPLRHCSGPIGAVAGVGGGFFRHSHRVRARRSAGPRRPRGKAAVRQLHHPRVRLGPRLGHVPVRRLRGGPGRTDLAADPRLLLSGHDADDAPVGEHHQGVGDQRQRRLTAGAARVRARGARQQRRPVPGADRRRVRLVADRPLRVGLPAQLPHPRRPLRHPADRAVEHHLVLLQLEPHRPGGAARRDGADLPRHGVPDQVGQQRPDRQPGDRRGLRPRRGPRRDADLLARRRGPRPVGRRPLVRGPAAQPGAPVRLRPV